MEENIKRLSQGEEDEILKKIQKGRISLLLKYPFFGILSLKFVVVQDYSCKTMATDGVHLFYNPYFVKSLNNYQELNFIIIHEIMHCALRHLWRRQNRAPKKFNKACDYAIHCILAKEHSDVISMPKSALYDPSYDGLVAEEIYERLPDDDYDEFDDHSFWDKVGKTDKNENGNGSAAGSSNLEREWEASVINAAKTVENSAKGVGSIPGFFKRYIDEITNPVKDWRILLREFIEPEIDDYTFVKPDYRIDYDEFGCFLPSFNEETDKLQKIIFWIDTSGSISDKELAKIYSEVAGAIEQFDIFNGYLGFFDHRAYKPTAFNDINSLQEIKPVGGGGTDFNVPFMYIKEHEELSDIKCVIMLTDGYCSFPTEETIGGLPTIWLITTPDIQSPHGQSIYLPLTEN